MVGRDRKSSRNHVCTSAPGLYRNFGKSANEDAGRDGEDCSIGSRYREICTDQSGHLHQEQRACVQGRVPPPGVSVKSALVQTSWLFTRRCARSRNSRHRRVFQGANECPDQPPRLHRPPGGEGRTLSYLRPAADILREAGRRRGVPLL